MVIALPRLSLSSGSRLLRLIRRISFHHRNSKGGLFTLRMTTKMQVERILREKWRFLIKRMRGESGFIASQD